MEEASEVRVCHWWGKLWTPRELWREVTLGGDNLLSHSVVALVVPWLICSPQSLLLVTFCGCFCYFVEWFSSSFQNHEFYCGWQDLNLQLSNFQGQRRTSSLVCRGQASHILRMWGEIVTPWEMRHFLFKGLAHNVILMVYRYICIVLAGWVPAYKGNPKISCQYLVRVASIKGRCTIDIFGSYFWCIHKLN